MITELFKRRLTKLIKEENLSTNELYETKSFIERQYFDALTKDNILKFIDNYKYADKEVKIKKEIRVI